VKNRQFSVKVLEIHIENEEETHAFLQKHHLLFKDHLLSLHGILSERLEAYLKEQGYLFVHNQTLPQGRSKKALVEEVQEQVQQPLQEAYEQLQAQLQATCVEHAVELQALNDELRLLRQRVNTKFTVLDKMVRSGQELKIEGDLLLLNRVNSGATISTTGNLIITQVVEGALRCDGAFMMITVSPKANIVFHGVEVDNALLENKLNRIELKENEIHITPVIKKEINWEQS
jgi:septum site-determining protein MinC